MQKKTKGNDTLDDLVKMATPHWTEVPDSMDVLDYWTIISLAAYWEEIVRETQQAHYTSRTKVKEESTGDTGDTGDN